MRKKSHFTIPLKTWEDNQKMEEKGLGKISNLMKLNIQLC